MFNRCVQVLLSEKCINRNIFLSYVKSVTTSTKFFQDFSDGNSVAADVEGSKSPVSSRSLPIAVKREFKYKNPYSPPKQINLESLDTVEENKIGVVDLHSDVFGAFPRIDIIHQNVKWQLTYKKINYESCATRAEKRGGGRKPWPQKGSGRARHGSIRSPLWKGGGRAFGPRGPQSYFYMIPYHLKVAGLCSALSVKLAQNNLHVVDSLELPSDEQEYIENLVEARNWGFSVLFVDDNDFMPRNISLAVKDKPSYNLMASYSLNVYSMLKHETLVLTLPALEKIEEKLVYHLNRTERHKKYHLTK